MNKTSRHKPAVVASLVVAPVIAGAWLFLAALPALADGGPHVASVNSGTSTLTSDSCAGCHRAHTATGPMIINQPSEELLCTTCHGAVATGATTDVMTGLQYRPGSVRGSAPLGALRGGGFDQARIASSTPARNMGSGSAINTRSKVSVGPAVDVTSAHLDLPENGLVTPHAAWGNDGINSGAGPTVSMSCGSCHNIHGNGYYRILQPVPVVTAAAGSSFIPIAAPGAVVTDAALPPAGDARNYTVIQVKGTQGTPSSFLLYASQVIAGNYASDAGDYWHVRVPWTDPSGMADAPNGNPSGLTPFNTQIEAWCTACHTRYHTEAGGPVDFSGDDIFGYKHQTTGRTTCTTCHVSHGSNARMAGTYSASFPYPDNVYSGGVGSNTSPSSRLLKVDNRGTCQLCHDPTGTVAAGTYTGPVPAPGAP